jgi:hypothetical protein
MGCQHSSLVPTAADFYHLPTSQGLSSMCETVERIENPGMCYSLRMEHIIRRTYKRRAREDRKSISERDSSVEDATAAGSSSTTSSSRRRRRPVSSPRRRATTRSITTTSSSTRITVNQNGLGFGKGMYLDGPFENNGTMILRTGLGKARAILKPVFHPSYSFYYELRCPHPPSNLMNDTSSSTFSTLGSSWSSMEQHFNNSFNETSVTRTTIETDETAKWFTWGTVHKIPHSLEYQMTLWLPPSDNNNTCSNDYPSTSLNDSTNRGGEEEYYIPTSGPNNKKKDEELVYVLRYCGSIFGTTCQMRIDKECDNNPLALLTENIIDLDYSARPLGVEPRVSSDDSSSNMSCASGGSSTSFVAGNMLDQNSNQKGGRSCKNTTTLESSWDLVIGPGVDPSLMICFAAIVNHGKSSLKR